MACADIDRRQAKRLLEVARAWARPVRPERLGYVGREAFPGYQYAVERETAELGSSKPQADIPFVVEAWARKTTPPKGKIEKSGDDIKINVLINRTPITTEVAAWRDGDKDICLRGNGLAHYCEEAPKKGAYDIRVNVTTPYCPITSDGKAPNLEPFVHEIITAIATATRKAQRAAPKDKGHRRRTSCSTISTTQSPASSGDGEYRFNERQIFYQLRPIVLEETGAEATDRQFQNDHHRL